MDSFSVRPEQLHSLSETIGSNGKQIQAALDGLNAEVGKLRGAWDGQAQAAYDDAHRKWNQSIAAMNDLLLRISAATTQIGSDYSTADRKSAQRFAG